MKINQQLDLEKRKQEEIAHSDRRRSIVKGFEYQTDIADNQAASKYVEDSEAYQQHFSNMKFYSISKASFAYRDSLLETGIKEAVALDYCCGNGEVALQMAKSGAGKVYAIDISTVAVDNGNELAKSMGLDSNIQFEVRDAENTGFDSDYFDVIHEYGALHHLELDAAYKEIARIIKPAGRVICTEALRHNPLIHWYRHRTPQLRTAWEVEHILGVPEIMKAKKYFETVNVKFFHLFALAAVPFRKNPFFKPMLRFLNFVDAIALRIPGIRRNAWVAVIELKGPKKL
jgi:ubiquinone/menaquinone biosynthesis C-methylase UbiE